MKLKLRGRPPSPRDYKGRTSNQARFLKAYARVGMIGVAAEMAGISRRSHVKWIPQAVPAGARASLLRARSEGEAPDCSKDGSNESRSPSSNSPGHSTASRRRSICQARFLKAYARVGMIGVAAEMAGISLVGLEKSGRLGTRSGPSESSPVWRPRFWGPDSDQKPT